MVVVVVVVVAVIAVVAPAFVGVFVISFLFACFWPQKPIKHIIGKAAAAPSPKETLVI